MKYHVLINGDWVGSIIANADELTQRREEIAQQYKVELHQVMLVEDGKLTYTKGS